MERRALLSPYFKLKTPTTLIFSDHPLCIVLSTRNEKVLQSSYSQGIYILEELDIPDNPKTVINIDTYNILWEFQAAGGI